VEKLKMAHGYDKIIKGDCSTCYGNCGDQTSELDSLNTYQRIHNQQQQTDDGLGVNLTFNYNTEQEEEASDNKYGSFGQNKSDDGYTLSVALNETENENEQQNQLFRDQESLERTTETSEAKPKTQVTITPSVQGKPVEMQGGKWQARDLHSKHGPSQENKLENKLKAMFG